MNQKMCVFHNQEMQLNTRYFQLLFLYFFFWSGLESPSLLHWKDNRSTLHTPTRHILATCLLTHTLAMRHFIWMKVNGRLSVPNNFWSNHFLDSSKYFSPCFHKVIIKAYGLLCRFAVHAQTRRHKQKQGHMQRFTILIQCADLLVKKSVKVNVVFRQSFLYPNNNPSKLGIWRYSGLDMSLSSWVTYVLDSESTLTKCTESI